MFFCKNWKNIVEIDCHRKIVHWLVVSNHQPSNTQITISQCTIASDDEMLVKLWFFSQPDYPTYRPQLSLLRPEGEAGWQILAQNFLGSSALITILRIFIKVWFSESILEYHTPSGPLTKYAEYFQKSFACLCYHLEYWVFVLFNRG